jgi:hypothetical protein
MLLNISTATSPAWYKIIFFYLVKGNTRANKSKNMDKIWNFHNSSKGLDTFQIQLVSIQKSIII